MRFPATLLAVSAAALLLTGVASAADKAGNYAIWGMGNQSCNAYNKARADDDADTFKFYVMGYLTAYNVHQGETYSISSAQPMPDILVWFDEYCDSHAIDSFENALKIFVHEHYEKRMKTIPNKYAR